MGIKEIKNGLKAAKVLSFVRLPCPFLYRQRLAVLRFFLRLGILLGCVSARTKLCVTKSPLGTAGNFLLIPFGTASLTKESAIGLITKKALVETKAVIDTLLVSTKTISEYIKKATLQ